MNKSSQEIQEMFDNISDKYDRLNNIISFGLHKIIKKKCVSLLNLTKDSKIVDLCSGTGDLSGIMEKYSSDITGLDFSEKMLNIAQKKFPNLKFVLGTCLNLPFENDSFDIVTMGYGLRNIPEKEKALQEIFRVLKHGGQFLQLDFGKKNFAGKIFEKAVPVFAKLFSDNKDAYTYLIKSKQDFLEPDELIKKVETLGFRLFLRQDFLFHAISCQIFVK